MSGTLIWLALCRFGRLTACLEEFQAGVDAAIDNHMEMNAKQKRRHWDFLERIYNDSGWVRNRDRRGKNLPSDDTRFNKEEVDINESWNRMSDEARELVLHADNDYHLQRSSHEPIIKSLKHKMKKGIYDPEKAKGLWRYHADRAAVSYAKEHGDGTP